MHDPETGRAETLDTLLQGPDSDIWTTSLTNEWGRCTNGMSKTRAPGKVIIGQQTMIFIFPHQVPKGRKITYANCVCTMRPGS